MKVACRLTADSSFVLEPGAIFKALSEDWNLMTDPGLLFATILSHNFLVNEGDF